MCSVCVCLVTLRKDEARNRKVKKRKEKKKKESNISQHPLLLTFDSFRDN
jgi:hypothetical protein